MLFLILIYVNFISLGLPDVLLGTAWPQMYREFAVALDAAGPVSMLISGTTILSGLMSGALLSRYGTGRVVAVSTLLTAVAMFGYAFAPSYVWLFPMCIPYGLGGGAIDTAINDYVAKYYKARQMNWLHAMWGLGAMIGPLILSATMATSGWRTGYLWVAAIQLALTVVMFITIPAWDRQAAGAGADIQPAKAAGTTIMQALAIPRVPFATGAFLLYCAAETVLSLWGASYLTELRGMDATAAAMWVSVYFGGITAGRILGGFLSAKLRSVAILRLGEVLAILGAVLVALPLPPLVCALGMLLFGLGLAPLFPTMLHMTPQRFGAEASARIIGLQISAAYIGATFMPPIVGWVANVTGIGILPYVMIGCVALELVCCELIDNRRGNPGIKNQTV